MAIDHGHLAEEIAFVQIAQVDVISIRIEHTDPDASALDQIHGVPGLAGAKEVGASLELAQLKNGAELLRCLLAERMEERNFAQVLELDRTAGAALVKRPLGNFRAWGNSHAGVSLWQGRSKPKAKSRHPLFARQVRGS